MNGRVYDPALGRFLSVDPVFQFPENTQSLNPYSYVMNSPLTATDPTGLTEKVGACGTGEECPAPPQKEEPKKEDKKDDHKPNQTRDPRSAHFARANAKFAESGKTEQGTTWRRNLANGTDTRYAAVRFDRLVGRLTDALEGLASRLDAYDAANSNAGGGGTVGFASANTQNGGTVAGGARNITPDGLRSMAGAFRGLLGNGLNVGAATEGPGGARYASNNVMNIFFHLVRLAGAYGYDWTQSYNSAPDRTMFLRVALGKSDKYTFAWFHHENYEAGELAGLRGASDDEYKAAQGLAHRNALTEHQNTQWDLFHPAVVRAFPEDFSDPRYPRG